MFGFLNVYKPTGMTSHDVVAILRKKLGIKQIGHTGTLDPFAQGVLPVAIGKATRLIEYLEDDKEYLAEISFGKNTDTYDVEGKVTQTTNKKVTSEDVCSALKSFEGEIFQTPPIYSAIKINGKKLYEYARANEEVELKPRKIYVEKIELKSFDAEKQTANVLIKCSKGTYIRSIAYDLGQKLNSGAYLSKLERTKVGVFKIKNTVKLENITSVEVASQFLQNPLDVLTLRKTYLDDEELKKISFGQQIFNKNNYNNNEKIILVYNNEVKAIANICDNMVKVKKVFQI